MNSVLEDVTPKTVYVNSDWVTWVFFSIVKILPRRWGDEARIRIMRLPQY